MSLDIDLIATREVSVYSANITHNLTDMALQAGIYRCLWRPEELGITSAKQLIDPLTLAIKAMEEKPDLYKMLNSKNGWGTYEDFLPWLKDLLKACIDNPDAKIESSR